MGRLRHRSRSLTMLMLLVSWGMLVNGVLTSGTGTATSLSTARYFPGRHPIPGCVKPNGLTEGACVISSRRDVRNASPSASARSSRPVLAFLPNCMLWGKLRSSKLEAAAVRDSYTDRSKNFKMGCSGDEVHSGGSEPPRGRGFGSWGWGGGGGDDGRGRSGGDDDWREGRDRFIALGATQGVLASRRSRYVSPYGPGGRRSGSSYRQPGRTRQTNRYSGDQPFSVTRFLTILNVIVFLFQSRYPAITRAGWKLAPAIVQQGQWYRLVTPIVLHGSLAHLLVNTMSFSSVGPLVERVLGSRKFLAVYLLSGIAGNILSCMVNPRLPAVGASGAIFGMVGAWGAFCLMNESIMGKANSQRALRSVAQTVMINVAYGMSSSQIDNMGHLGGFLGGAVVTFLIGPRLRRMLNPYTGQMYTVDDSPKLSLPRFGRRSGERR